MAAFAGASAHAATEIQFWHSMEGALGDRVNGLVDEFNKKNPEYQVKAVYKGNYGESMNAGIAAFRAGNAPDILQVFEVGTATMMYAKGAIKPVQQMSEEAGNPIDPKEFIGAVAGYLVGRRQAGVDAVQQLHRGVLLQQGRLQEGRPGRRQAAQDLGRAGRRRPEAQGRRPGMRLHHLVAVLGPAGNVLGLAQRALRHQGQRLRRPGRPRCREHPLHVRHLENLAKLGKEGIFMYGGRGDEPNSLFISGKCAMITGSSGLRANIAKNAKFEFGTSTLPYYSDVQGAPQNTIIGGASLWVFANKKPETYKGVTAFFVPGQPEIAARWHQQTGYVPVTKAAYELTRRKASTTRTPAPKSASSS